MRHVDDIDTLTAVAKVAEKSSSTPYLLVKNGGKDGAKLMRQLGDSHDAIEIQRVAARKGRAGISFARKLCWSERFCRTIRAGRLGELLKQICIKYVWIRRCLGVAGASCLLFGLYFTRELWLWCPKLIKKILRSKIKSAQTRTTV